MVWDIVDIWLQSLFWTLIYRALSKDRFTRDYSCPKTRVFERVIQNYNLKRTWRACSKIAWKPNLLSCHQRVVWKANHNIAVFKGSFMCPIDISLCSSLWNIGRQNIMWNRATSNSSTEDYAIVKRPILDHSWKSQFIRIGIFLQNNQILILRDSLLWKHIQRTKDMDHLGNAR